jgi:hypothetical protein
MICIEFRRLLVCKNICFIFHNSTIQTVPKTKRTMVKRKRTKFTTKNVNGEDFCTLKELEDRVRKILNSTESKDIVFFQSLLELHIDKDVLLLNRKLVDYEVNTNNCKGIGVNLLFDDNTRKNLHSWKKNCKCVFLPDDRARNRFRKSRNVEAFKTAARNEVSGQTQSFRNSASEEKQDPTKYHVGHDYEKAKRFDEIFQNFCEDELEQDNDFGIENIGRKKMFADRNKAKDWQEFHKQHAVLRMETASENLRGNRGFQNTSWANPFVTVKKNK